MGNFSALLSGAVLFCLAAASVSAAGTDGCTLELTGYSAFFGAKSSGAKFIDHSALINKGRIKNVSMYFSKSAGCLRGAKVVMDTPAPTPGVIGNSINATEVVLKLSEGEYITKAEHKTSKCIEYVKLYTNKGRSAFAGLPNAPAPLVQLYPGKGRLLSIRGFQTMNDTKAGPLQQLQLVWGVQNCPTSSASSSSNPVSTSAMRKAAPAKVAIASFAPDVDIEVMPDVANSSAALAPVSVVPLKDPTVCAAKVDMCNEKASMNQFTYCVWNPPFTKSACKGGCCFSSGKCASSSCTISGMGRDVSNMICYGVNSGVGFGGSNQCSGLACKLATPGCTTDAFGGNCVGTVVPFKSENDVHPESKRYIGAACLDATPSDTTLDAKGNPSDDGGIYMGKLWTICDCSDSGSSLPGDLASNLLNLTTASLSNITKNDVLLAVSQLLPKINLSDVISHDDDAGTGTELIPSFTDFFKLPALPTITMPDFLGGASSSNGSVPPIQLPNLQGLLGQLASKVGNTTAATAAPAEATTTASNTGSSDALSGIKDLLAKIVPVIESVKVAPETTSSSTGDATKTADSATPTSSSSGGSAESSSSPSSSS